MPPIFPSHLLVPIFTLVVLLRVLPLSLHLGQLVVQSHVVAGVIENRVLTFEQWPDEAVEVRVGLGWRVGRLHLGKVRLVYRSVPFAEGRVDNVVTECEGVDKRNCLSAESYT